MRKFGLTLPVAGLAVSVAGLMGGGLSGQTPHIVPGTSAPVLELLPPEFEPAMGETFQTPVLELETSEALPIVVPGIKLTPSVPMVETTPIEMPPAEVPQPCTPPLEPAWMKLVPQAILETPPMPIPARFEARAPGGLPDLPEPPLPSPGHSRGRVSERPRPGHSVPKPPSESTTHLRAW